MRRRNGSRAGAWGVLAVLAAGCFSLGPDHPPLYVTLVAEPGASGLVNVTARLDEEVRHQAEHDANAGTVQVDGPEGTYVVNLVHVATGARTGRNLDTAACDGVLDWVVTWTVDGAFDAAEPECRDSVM